MNLPYNKYVNELNIPIEQLRSELIEFNNLWPHIPDTEKNEANCITCTYEGKPINDGMMYYCPPKLCIKYGCHSLTKLWETFNGGLLSRVRIMTMLPGQEIPFHIGNDSAGENLFTEEIPPFMTINGTLNILLSKPKGDITEFARNKDLTKYTPRFGGKYVPQKEAFNNPNVPTIATHELTEAPVIINSGSWHRVRVNQEGVRILASFMFWPTLTYDNIAHFCHSNKLIL